MYIQIEKLAPSPCGLTGHYIGTGSTDGLKFVQWGPTVTEKKVN